ncbi:MAG: hypothetical protein AAGC99_20175, partial [Pseudomonadota bacterium]
LSADLAHALPPALDLPREKQHRMVTSPSLQRFTHEGSDGALVSGWHQPYSEVFFNETGSSYGFETRATYRLVPGDPLSAESTVEHRAVHRRSDGTAELSCTVKLRADDRFYHLEGRLVADWEGAHLAERNWTSAVPRKHG